MELLHVNRIAGFAAGGALDPSADTSASSKRRREDTEARIELRHDMLITAIADGARNDLNIRELQMRIEIARVAEARGISQQCVCERSGEAAASRLRQRHAFLVNGVSWSMES